MAPLLSEEELALGDPYEILGVPVDATEKQIQSAYRKLSIKSHPDRFPNDEEKARQFFAISLAVNLLTDPAKRSFLNVRLDEERQRKEKTAGMEKRKRTMVEALQAREEEAKRAKLDIARRHAEASAEADVQEQGRKMREQAAMAVEAARLQAVEEERQRLRQLNTPTRSNGSGSLSGSATNGREGADITSLDLTLMMQFPMGEDKSIASSADALRSALSARYGPLENIDLLPQAGPSSTKPDDVKAKKQKKPKGPRWAVEFKRSNRDGCWACWKDHLEAEGKSGRPLVKGLKVKFAGKKDGEAPDWVANLSAGSHNGNHPIDQSIPPTTSTPVVAAPAPPRISHAFASSFASSTFPSVPSSFLTPESKRKQQEVERERAAVDDFESGILFRMRQQEREKLEREIRRQEAEEA